MAPPIDVIFYAIALTAAVASATYVQPWNSRDVSPDEKTNDIGYDSTRRESFFKDDLEIRRYLKTHGHQLMIWQCKNAIQHFLHGDQSLPYIDLHCNVIGTVMTVTWHHRGQLIAGNAGNWNQHRHSHHRHLREKNQLSISTSSTQGELPSSTSASRYQLTIKTHSDAGIYYLAWLNFRLRINNATHRDSGQYTFGVIGPDNEVDEHKIFVDIRQTFPTIVRSSATDRGRDTAAVVGHTKKRGGAKERNDRKGLNKQANRKRRQSKNKRKKAFRKYFVNDAFQKENR